MNKLAVITGGSRGIGRATALALAGEGFDIVLTYQSQETKARTVVEEIESLGQRAFSECANLRDETSIVRLFKNVGEIGPLSVLVNNSGILDTQGALRDFSAERMRNIIETNVLGTLLCCREAIPLMSKQSAGPGGSIVNIGSGASRSGSPFEYVDYAASKGAIDSMTIGLAKELVPDGIRVNCVRPGPIHTEIHADGGEPNRIDRIKDRIPMKRGGTAQEVANAVVFLATEASSYTTGSFIDVSGGA